MLLLWFSTNAPSARYASMFPYERSPFSDPLTFPVQPLTPFGLEPLLDGSLRRELSPRFLFVGRTTLLHLLIYHRNTEPNHRTASASATRRHDYFEPFTL